jgi:hypothetical protein
MHDDGDVSASEHQLVRPLQLPWEGIESLRTVLGIVDDHELKVDAQALASLTEKLDQARGSNGPMAAGSEGVELVLLLTMPEAGLLLDALHFTDMMSMHLPFYDTVVETVQFIGDRLTALWSAHAWMTWRDEG